MTTYAARSVSDRSQRRRAPDEWIRLDAPELRIIGEDLWKTVSARLEQAREALPRSFQGGRLLGRPSYLDGDSPYLLTGLTRCSICRGAIGSIPRSHGRGHDRRKVDYYGCFTNHRRGTAICSNKIHIQQQLLDNALLGAINEALDERILALAVDKALTRLRAGQIEHLDRRTQVERELSLIESRERRLVEAIRHGETVEPLVAALKEEGERKKALVAELEGLARVAQLASFDADRIKTDLRARVADVKGLLARRKPQARQMLRKVLASQIELTPIEENGRRGYRFSAQGTFEKLLSGAVLEALPRTVVAPTGTVLPAVRP